MTGDARLTDTNAMQAPETPAATPGPGLSRTTHLRVLSWLFALFNSVRVLAYLPTMWSIRASADSSQHSLVTWAIFAGANATMAAWLYEQNGRRVNRAIAVNTGNAMMCVAISVFVVAYRV